MESKIIILNQQQQSLLQHVEIKSVTMKMESEQVAYLITTHLLHHSIIISHHLPRKKNISSNNSINFFLCLWGRNDEDAVVKGQLSWYLYHTLLMLFFFNISLKTLGLLHTCIQTTYKDELAVLQNCMYSPVWKIYVYFFHNIFSNYGGRSTRTKKNMYWREQRSTGGW